MEIMNVSEYRNNLAMVFNRVDAGERVIVRRRNKQYAIVPVEDDDLAITPQLQLKIEQARKEHLEGKTIVCKDKEELDKFLDSL